MIRIIFAISMVTMLITAFTCQAPAAGRSISPVGQAGPGRSTAPTATGGVRDTQGAQPVTIGRHNGRFQLNRSGRPYFIKGVGGHRFLGRAAAAGANSVRTWDVRDADILLPHAQNLRMTVLLGIWLSHDAADYESPSYLKSQTQRIRRLVARYRHHPALLMWALGNEINLEGADTEPAWHFVNQMARLIKNEDPNHPVISVIACKAATLEHIATFAPALDAVGINAYGAVPRLRRMVERSSYRGPYLITEWGVTGHWEARHTAWGRPIEPTSARKSEFQLERYQRDILANQDRCIGSYLFLWGHKQERTPTWYSMILEDLPGTGRGALASPAVDVMHYNWTGNWPENRAPEVRGLQINGISSDHDIVLQPGAPMQSRVEAWDPENDRLSYVWELLKEPTILGTGGSYEPRPASLATVQEAVSPQLNLRAPLLAGEYRLFVYVLDHKGHVATANLPFRVYTVAEEERPSPPLIGVLEHQLSERTADTAN